ncbi:BREX-2 system adenine-specific DNA-methyltransferase PglX [Microbulbifer sp. ZKSA004]|uniref:BREX-2 system adenine-specific DNA-methyltransferase PglX n=1 Tax=Microbulbifer sp. ZKSA004 TaxID=3243389 RepID=UPI00403A0487
MIDRNALLKDLQGELPKIEKDILAYSESRDDLTVHLQEEYEKAREAGRTAEHFVAWREAQITQAAVAWVLSCVFVRFLEDNELLTEPVLAGPVDSAQGEKRLDHAKQRMVAYFNENPTHEEREYLFSLFEDLEKFPVIAELLDHRHNPLWQIPVSADGAKQLIDFFQKIDAESGEVIHDFTDSEWDTRFLGDLYQDLSESVRKRYALLQTPEFVESFILDYTLEKAKDTFGLPGLRLIDPTCGSGHFLLTTFERVFDDWVKREPATNTRELAQRALDVVHGVDINPYAIAICRFRLLIASMKASGANKVKDAPNFHFNLACGDSLLHGYRFEWQGQGLQTNLLDEDPVKHVLEVEDKEKLLKILGQRYHAVVGNPPYIVVRDKALNQAYRDRYPTCHRQYSLGVPFTERFFDLTISPGDGLPAGFMGMITANSFMKREFGTKLIEEYLIRRDLTHIIDTSGAYIPGHGTPTVILFARNQESKPDKKIRVALGVRAEPKTPDNPAFGKVWSAIECGIDKVGDDNEFVSIEDRDRESYSVHPWSLTGGGASETKSLIDENSAGSLGDVAPVIGRMMHTACDDAYFAPLDAWTRYTGDNRWSIGVVEGEFVRDWELKLKTGCIFPYDDDLNPTLNLPDVKLRSVLWPNKQVLRNRREPNGFQEEIGLIWFEWSRFQKERFLSEMSISFAEVASHNHFVLDRGGKVFKQTAPIIKLNSEATQEDYLSMTAYLNSSLSCFYMKQICHQKQMTGGDGVRIEFVSKVPYQFSGTALKKIPLPREMKEGEFRCSILALSKLADSLAAECGNLSGDWVLENALENGVDLENSWNEALSKRKVIRSKQVIVQEEIDWSCYWAFGLVDKSFLFNIEEWLGVDVNVGQRPFEILSQLNQDGFDVPNEIPKEWPKTMKEAWRSRIKAIQDVKEIRVIEDPHYKRRWIGRQGLFNKSAKLDEFSLSCKAWMLRSLEFNYLRNSDELTTCASLADRVRGDKDFVKVASFYKGDELFDFQQLISDLVSESNVPQFSSGRYKPKAMKKFRAWQETWKKQRQEDEIDVEFGVDQPLSESDSIDPDKLAVYENAKKQAESKKANAVGAIPIPPKYIAGDFRKSSYWPLRGKLDVPKERFFSLPGCEKEGDSTLVIGWAGMNHLQRAQAIASWYIDRKEGEGWQADKLTPMLVAIDELIPWLKQWHNEIDPEFGERMGDYYEGFLLEELRQLNVSRDELLNWEPPAPARARRGRARRTVAE